jgi:hypothetical protein
MLGSVKDVPFDVLERHALGDLTGLLTLAAIVSNFVVTGDKHNQERLTQQRTCQRLREE